MRLVARCDTGADCRGWPRWAARAADVTLTETGSTLLLPLFDIMVPDYLKTHPGVQITTAGTGSGAGQQQALSGQVMIGASDAYMSDREVRDNPTFLDIPLAISAQTINYNVPGLNTTNLRLDGPAIAGIYTGAIRQMGCAGDRRAQSRRRIATSGGSSRYVALTVPVTRSFSPNS